jgi:hypothetical protein
MGVFPYPCIPIKPIGIVGFAGDPAINPIYGTITLIVWLAKAQISTLKR